MANYTTSYLGPSLVSLVLSATLYGCALVQTHVYYKLFPKDSWKFRILVASEMCLQTVHLALLALGMWQTVMTDYAQRPQILALPLTLAIGIGFSGPIAFCAQAFFVFRLYTFSQKKALPIFCSLLVVTQFVFTLMVSMATVAARDLSLQPWQRFIISALFITICADTTIAVSMSYYLKASESGFHQTSRVVDRIVLYVMATGTITSISALASGLFILITPDIFIWLGLFIIESGCEFIVSRIWQPVSDLIRADALLLKVYTNSLLAALNARAKFSHELQYSESADGLEVQLGGLGIQQLHT
ncbi:hypothetical protein EDC04DRAFT_3088354 [Pisolithus marmoratus]|nr:hypothetical protein EDC04DRAFT_3088354 [Pisolithus marmoratus]